MPAVKIKTNIAAQSAAKFMAQPFVNRYLTLLSSIHASHKFGNINTAKNWSRLFQHRFVGEKDEYFRPIYEVKTHLERPPREYFDEINQAEANGFNVIAIYKTGLVVKSGQDKRELSRRINSHVDQLVGHGCNLYGFSLDNEPDITIGGYPEEFKDYAETFELICNELENMREPNSATEDWRTALPSFDPWGKWGSEATTYFKANISYRPDFFLYHWYGLHPSGQFTYRMRKQLAARLDSPLIKSDPNGLIIGETAIDFIGEGGIKGSKPHVQNNYGAIYYGAQFAASVLTDAPACDFIAAEANNGILSRFIKTPRLKVIRAIQKHLLLEGYYLQKELSFSEGSHFKLSFYNTTTFKKRVLEGIYHYPYYNNKSMAKAIRMTNPGDDFLVLQRLDIDSYEEAAKAANKTFESKSIPPLGKVFFEIQHEASFLRISDS